MQSAEYVRVDENQEAVVACHEEGESSVRAPLQADDADAEEAVGSVGERVTLLLDLRNRTQGR